MLLDTSAKGIKDGVIHFLKGVVLYAAVGAIGYAVSVVGNLHATTPEALLAVTLISEALQGASKWLKTVHIDDQVEVPVQSVVDEPVSEVVG